MTGEDRYVGLLHHAPNRLLHIIYGEINLKEEVERLRDRLSPEWLRDCVMIDTKNNALVIAPKECLKRKITNVIVVQGQFTSKTIIKVRLDFDLIKIKKAEPIE